MIFWRRRRAAGIASAGRRGQWGAASQQGRFPSVGSAWSALQIYYELLRSACIWHYLLAGCSFKPSKDRVRNQWCRAPGQATCSREEWRWFSYGLTRDARLMTVYTRLDFSRFPESSLLLRDWSLVSTWYGQLSSWSDLNRDFDHPYHLIASRDFLLPHFCPLPFWCPLLFSSLLP